MRPLPLALLAACAHQAPVSDATPAAPPPPATGVPGLDALLVPGAVVVFGEVHGTRQGPAFVADAVRAAARTGPVLLGLEIERDEQPRIDAFLASDGGAEARDALVHGAFWHRPFQDGRSSHAMVALLDAARTAGARVLAFDHAATSPNQRDADMAARLAEAPAAAPDATLLVLVGDLHAREVAGLPPAPELVPMAMQLAQRVPSVVTLDLVAAGGTYWACLGPTTADCGVQDATAKDVGPIRVDRSSPPEGYDGVWVVGPITASYPARDPTAPG
ncbi:MAG: hypothetical protein R3F59_25745 [Myxococcota bacterium]